MGSLGFPHLPPPAKSPISELTPERGPRRLFNQARFEAFGQGGAIKIFSDEDEGVRAIFAITPFSIKLSIEEHVDTLADETLVGPFDHQHALQAEDIATFGFE